MATLETDEPNIVDAEAINWRLIVYPVLVVLIVGAGALGYYYYLQNQREVAETDARAALVKATTPEEFLKVAAQFPQTDQAMLAILQAADASFANRDFAAALDDYRKITGNPAIDAPWHDTAELGVASCHEAMGNTDQAIIAYLEVARRADKSPYAPFAYNAVARIYENRGDKMNETATLQQAAALDPDSFFTKRAQEMLKELQPAAPPMTVNVPPTAPAAPAPPTK